MASRSCPGCFWSGDINRLLSRDDENYRFKALSAKHLRRRWQPNCLCCSILKGFLEAAGSLTSRSAVLRRDDGQLLYEKKGSGGDSEHIEIVILDDNKPPAADRPMPFLRHLPYRIGNTSSSRSLEWVKGQLARCVTTHKRCNMLQEAFLPTRLIRVTPSSQSRDVVLEMSSEISGHPRYIALSHCWGRITIPCLTTSANYSRQRQRIPWESLTRTFQDAVNVTQGLGIDYLWIDSICIIQGDHDDWLKESTTMCSVYQNAYATLVGFHAQDGNGGLYSSGAWPLYEFLEPIVFEGHSYYLYAKPKLPSFHSWYSPDIPRQSPLFDRAWCYQERIVSARVVYFTQDEIVWECFSETACECAEPNLAQEVDNPKLHHIAAFLDEDHDTLRADVLARTTQTGLRGIGSANSDNATSRAISPEETRQEYRIRQWHNTVEYYSELSITNELDRLPAVGALAQQYQLVRKSDTYLAGLWRSSLVSDLSWFPTLANTQRISDIYVAPSWSWASVRSSVQFLLLKTSRVKVLDAECCYVDNKSFGLAASGMITLEGALAPFVLRQDPMIPQVGEDFEYESSEEDDDNRKDDKGFYLWQERCKVRVGDFYVDGGKDSVRQDIQQLYVLELGPEAGREGVFYLLLGKAENNGENAEAELYSRLGCVFWPTDGESGLFHRCKEVTEITVCKIV